MSITGIRWVERRVQVDNETEHWHGPIYNKVLQYRIDNLWIDCPAVKE